MNNQTKPLSLIELKKMYRQPRNAARETREAFRWHESFALSITKRIGSIGFFFIMFLWTVTWIFWNVFAPIQYRFDPYPSFVIWLFVSNMIQLFVLPLILIGQNLQSRSFEADAEADYELNRKSSHEIETILHHLEYQEGILEEIKNRP